MLPLSCTHCIPTVTSYLLEVSEASSDLQYRNIDKYALLLAVCVTSDKRVTSKNTLQCSSNINWKWIHTNKSYRANFKNANVTS